MDVEAFVLAKATINGALGTDELETEAKQIKPAINELYGLIGGEGKHLYQHNIQIICSPDDGADFSAILTFSLINNSNVCIAEFDELLDAIKTGTQLRPVNGFITIEDATMNLTFLRIQNQKISIPYVTDDGTQKPAYISASDGAIITDIIETLL